MVSAPAKQVSIIRPAEALYEGLYHHNRLHPAIKQRPVISGLEAFAWPPGVANVSTRPHRGHPSKFRLCAVDLTVSLGCDGASTVPDSPHGRVPVLDYRWEPATPVLANEKGANSVMSSKVKLGAG